MNEKMADALRDALSFDYYAALMGALDTPGQMIEVRGKFVKPDAFNDIIRNAVLDALTFEPTDAAEIIFVYRCANCGSWYDHSWKENVDECPECDAPFPSKPTHRLVPIGGTDA